MNESPPLFKVDGRLALILEPGEGGKVRMTCRAWEEAKVLLPGQGLEVRRGAQGIEARVVTVDAALSDAASLEAAGYG